MSCGSTRFPPRKIQLPPNLYEASGISFLSDLSSVYLHNDSGDGPFVYQLNTDGSLAGISSLGTDAVDWEDICQAPNGLLYLGDFGNNRGRRKDLKIYCYTPATGAVDSIGFTYPGQNGQGRTIAGNYDCEAMVWFQNDLHLFTKAQPGLRKKYWSYHFRLPSTPGQYQAELVDSLYINKRTITGAALDTSTNELVLISYNFKRWLGFFPVVASSLITLTDYPEDQFYRGKLRRRNVSWGLPIQYEGVSIFNDDFVYIVTEKTPIRRAFLKRKRRR